MMKFSNKAMLGTIRSSRYPYYDSNSNMIAFKNRPILILKVENEYGNTDVTAIPVSKISDDKRIIVGYDIKVEKHKYPLLNLKENVSYIRTSKVTTINSGSIGVNHISDLRKEYPALFDEIVNKVKHHINKIGYDS